MNEESTSVLVVGGSLVGLSAAVFLAKRGVKTVLVEPHLGNSPHPRAIGYTARTMELFHAAGLGAQIPAVPAGFSLRRCRVESLAGQWFEENRWTPQQRTPDATSSAPASEVSPYTGAAIAQDRLEVLLRDRARDLGAELRLGTRLVRFDQDSHGVTAALRDQDGREHTLRASYVIATDGNRSSVREALGIGRQGPGPLQTMRSVLFRAPLDAYLERGVSQFEIDQGDFKAFLTTYGDGRWVLMFHDDLERDEETLLRDVRRAIGREDIPVEIVTTGRWELAALIADRFSAGRVFLAGDAAHTLPPTRGGYGANTGIHDAHNLAWKLDAVLSGASRPELLDTYDQERRPVAWVRMEQTFARPDYARHSKGFAQGVPILPETAVELGQLYRSSAVIGAGEELPSTLPPEQWKGQPGTRAPHLWIRRNGRQTSTLELVGHGWALIAAGPGWHEATREATRQLHVAVEAFRVGVDFDVADADAFRMGLGIDSSGATLIRPDSYVAWRSHSLPADPYADLVSALREVASSTA